MNERQTFDFDRLSDTIVSPERGRTCDEECPDPGHIWEGVCGQLAPAELAEIALHAARCPSCAHDLRAARQVAEEIGELEPVATLKPGWAAKAAEDAGRAIAEVVGVEIQAAWAAIGAGGAVLASWAGVERGRGGEYVIGRRPLVAALTLVAASVAVLLLSPPPPRPWPVPNQSMRDHSAPIVQLLIPDGQTLPRDRFVLRWQGLEKARYDVRIMTTNLDEVAFFTNLTSPRLRVDEKELAEFKAGTTLVWQTEAFLPDGERIASSTFRVQLE